MNRKRAAFIGIVPLLLAVSACSAGKQSALVQSHQSYQPETDARIRLYGPYGDRQIKHYSGQGCEQWRAGAGAKVHTRFKNGLPRRVSNVSAGMPATARSEAAVKDTGAVFRDSFKEYVVKAGEPLTLDAANLVQMSRRGSACRVAVNFVPKAGRDYEAAYAEENGRCTVKVYEILNGNHGLAAVRELQGLNGCSHPDGKPY